MGQSAITSVNLGSPNFVQSFTNGDLSSGVLTVNHNLNAQYVSVTVFNNNGLIIIPDDVDAVSATQITVDLTSFGTLTGTWQVTIVNTGGTFSRTEAQDLNLSGQTTDDIAVFNGTNWVAQAPSTTQTFTAHVNRDRSLGAGTQTVTGVGFTPTAVVIFAGMNTAGLGSFGLASSGGTDSSSISDYHNVGANGWDRRTSRPIALVDGGPTEYTGNITSYDVDGFTITWSSSGSPTGTAEMVFLAIA